MASRDCASVGMLLYIFLCLGSAHRLLLEHHEHNLAPSLAQAPSPSKHIHEHSLAPSLAPTPSPNEHAHEHSLAPSLSPAPSPNKHIHEHSLAPSLSPAPSPTKYIHEHSLAPSLAVAPSPSKHIHPVHHEWTYESAKEVKGPKTEHQKPVSEPVRDVRPGHDPTTEPWFFDSHGDKPFSKPWAVLPRNNPTTDQQHEHSVPRRRVNRPDPREGSHDDFIFGGTSSNSPYDTGHGNPEDEPFSSQLDSLYERSPPGN